MLAFKNSVVKQHKINSCLPGLWMGRPSASENCLLDVFSSRFSEYIVNTNKSASRLCGAGRGGGGEGGWSCRC